MSDSVQKLIEVVKKDEIKMAKFKACKSAEEQSKLASELGFKVSAKEFEQLSKNLSDEQLDQVAGGSCGFNFLIG